jgi:hypothetical protein
MPTLPECNGRPRRHTRFGIRSACHTLRHRFLDRMVVASSNRGTPLFEFAPLVTPYEELTSSLLVAADWVQ